MIMDRNGYIILHRCETKDSPNETINIPIGPYKTYKEAHNQMCESLCYSLRDWVTNNGYRMTEYWYDVERECEEMQSGYTVTDDERGTTITEIYSILEICKN